MKFNGKIFVSICLLGFFSVAMPSLTKAEPIHDKQVNTRVNPDWSPMQESRRKKVSMQTAARPAIEINTGKRSLSERIQGILHPPVPEKQEKPVIQMDVDSIMGRPLATQEQCVKYLLSVNPQPAIAVSPERLVSYYYEEGEREGVRPDVAFAQALKETGYFRYGGTVTPDQNNYCGLGTTSTVVKGAYFDSSQLGVRAHIQHLLAYASTRLPKAPVVDPRYDLVRSVYGDNTLGKWEELNGRWAVPGYTYGQSILELFNNILKE